MKGEMKKGKIEVLQICPCGFIAQAYTMFS